MRYELGLMDMYPIEASGTNIENNPMFKLVMKNVIDPIKLEDAVYRAIKLHPLFGTQVKNDGLYYLETNNRPIKLIHASEANRPLEFCKKTNGFPWQLCWDGKEITFEWCHGITDGKGAFDFLKSIISIYCGEKIDNIPRKIMLGPGLEPFVNPNENGINFCKQPNGFSISSLPVFKRGYQTDCHVLECSTQEILNLAKKNDSSPAAILAVLMSKAIRESLPETTKNKNVACNVVLDLRKPLNYETMHNCVEYQRITYQDKHVGMSLRDVAHEYKEIMDHARIYENVVRLITARVTLFKSYHVIRGKKMRNLVLGLLGKILKDRDCNCVLTYLGNDGLSMEVVEQIEDMQIRVWHDFGEFTLAALDFNGTFKINICENYVKKGIVENFASMCQAEGVNMKYIETFIYEQGKFIEETSIDKTSYEKETISKTYVNQEKDTNISFGYPPAVPSFGTASLIRSAVKRWVID